MTESAPRRIRRAHPPGPAAPLWLLALAAVSASAALIPLVYLVVRATDAGLTELGATLLRPRMLALTVNTVLLAGAVTLACLVLGTACGWVLTRVRLPGASGDLEAVARTLGRGPWRAFRQATWPRIRPAAVAGSLLVCLYTLSDFGLVSMLRYQTLTWGIDAAYGARFNRNQAALLALVLVVPALIVVAGERFSRGRAGTAIGRLLEAATLCAIDPQRLAEAIIATLGLAVGGVLLAARLALPIAALAARYRGRLVTANEAAGFLGHALPGIVVGLALVSFALAAVPRL